MTGKDISLKVCFEITNYLIAKKLWAYSIKPFILCSTKSVPDQCGKETSIIIGIDGERWPWRIKK